MRRLLKREILIAASLGALGAVYLGRAGAADPSEERVARDAARARPHASPPAAHSQLRHVARQANGRSARATQAPPSPPITERAIASMSVLRRPQTDEDRDLERAAEREIGLLTDAEGAPPEFWPGNPIEGSLRVLASGLGSSSGDLYAFATDRGRVCGGLLGAAVGCVEGFFEGDGVVNWTIGTSDDGRGTVLFGFAPDRVRALWALHGDERADAALVDNGFFIEIPGVERSLVDWLVISFDDGSEERVSLRAGG